jgi:hypothetical protein
MVKISSTEFPITVDITLKTFNNIKTSAHMNYIIEKKRHHICKRRVCYINRQEWAVGMEFCIEYFHGESLGLDILSMALSIPIVAMCRRTSIPRTNVLFTCIFKLKKHYYCQGVPLVKLIKIVV